MGDEFTPSSAGISSQYARGIHNLAGFDLTIPYPNPFNQTTTIEFFMPQSGWPTLTVYDLRGREVTTLVDSPEGSGSPLRSNWHEAGRHSVEWNASKVSSGIYFIRMQSQNFTQVRKVTVLK